MIERRLLPFHWLVGIGALIALAGCGISSRSSVAPTNVDAQSAAAEAIQLFDKDGDGKLSVAELDACPAIKQNRERYDQDGDNAITGEEIAARLTHLYPESVGLLTVECVATRQGRPLSGAMVKFIPEKFLGEGTEPASGTTDQNGAVSPSVSPEKLPSHLQNTKLMQPGLYRVEIEHPNAPTNGNVIGAEIDPSSRDGTTVRINL